MVSVPVLVLRFVTSLIWLFIPVFVLVLAFSCPCYANPEQEAIHIFSLINKRLGYMEQVAFYKYQSHTPVEDLTREKFILEESLLSATEQGLAPDSISGFFQAQMDAAKAIQYRYRADWLSSPPEDLQAVDLNTDIRPRLITLGKDIVTGISEYLKKGQSFNPEQLAAFMKVMEVHNLSPVDKEKIFKSLSQVGIYNKLLNK